MKKFRKIMAVLVAAVLMVAMMVPAWAASGRFDVSDGIVVVNNVNQGENYALYKIFDLASFSDSTVGPSGNNSHADDKYAYVLADKVIGEGGTEVDNPWKDFFGTTAYNFAANGKGSAYIDVDFDHPVYISKTNDYDDAEKYYPVVAIKTGPGAFNENAGAAQPPEKDFDLDALYSHSSQDFARKALEYAEGDDDIVAVQTITGNTVNSITWSSLDLGYYLVSSSLGTLVTLDTTNKTATVNDKNVDATTVKKVQEDQISSDLDENNLGDGVTGYQDDNDADIGEYVYYRSVINIGKGAVKYVAHDKMSTGLSFDSTYETDGAKIYLVKDYNPATTDLTTCSEVPTTGVVEDATNGATEDLGENDTNNWTLVTPGTESDLGSKCTFEISFTEDFLNNVDNIITNAAHSVGEYSLVILYRARLNKSAVIGLDGNTNEFWLSFGEAQRTNTTHIVTTTYTWALDLFKYYEASSETGLSDAQFQIKRGTDTTPLQFVEIAKGVYRYEAGAQADNWTLATLETASDKLADGTTAKTASEFRLYKIDSLNGDSNTKVVNKLETDANGKLNIIGLDGDDYVITETLAPRGFNKQVDDIYVHIDSVVDDANNTYTGTGGADLTKGQVIRTADQGDAAGTTAVATTVSTGLTQDQKNPTQRMIKILNTTTKELPSTGGAGTTVLYIVGGMLVILAGAYLFFSRKKTA